MDQHKFEQKIKDHLKRAGLSQAAAARKLHYTPEQFNKWVRGVNRIPDVAIQEISEFLGLSDEERIELFTLAGYVAVTALKKEGGATDVAGVSAGANASTAANNRNVVSIRLDRAFFMEALKNWRDDIFDWSEAKEHNRSSWAGMVLYSFSKMMERVTPRGLLIVSVSLLLGVITIQLTAPVFQWPLEEAEVRRMAYLKYGLATVLIPFLVACLTPPDKFNLFQLETVRQRTTFWVLKFTGALVGFWVFAMIFIGLTLVLYYLHVPPLPAGIRAGFAMIPLFFSYIIARRIPIDRHNMFDGQLRLHPADRLFLTVFVFVGPLSAIFLYAFYGFLTDNNLAPIMLLSIITVIAIWEYRKQDRHLISDPISILVLGLLFPAVILLYTFFLTPQAPLLSIVELPYIIVISIYFLSWTLMVATVLVRKPPVLTLTGVFSMLALLTVLTGVSLYLLFSNTVALWINGLSFLIISLALIGWTYRV